jgi:ribosomal protein S18 acetylase RimI-like enzyme
MESADQRLTRRGGMTGAGRAHRIERYAGWPPPDRGAQVLGLADLIQRQQPYAYADWEVRPVAQWMPEMMRTLGAALYLAADSARVVGYCITMPLTSMQPGSVPQALRAGTDTWYIAELGVAPAHRREGIASALLYAALAGPAGRETGWLVRTLAGNEPAIRLYQGFGFAVVPEVRETHHGRARIFLRRPPSPEPGRSAPNSAAPGGSARE